LTVAASGCLECLWWDAGKASINTIDSRR
jgi:hypothetical protein